MINYMDLYMLGFWDKPLYLKYSLVLAELAFKQKADVKLLVRSRNALGRYVATLGIRCGLCAFLHPELLHSNRCGYHG